MKKHQISLKGKRLNSSIKAKMSTIENIYNLGDINSKTTPSTLLKNTRTTGEPPPSSPPSSKSNNDAEEGNLIP